MEKKFRFYIWECFCTLFHHKWEGINKVEAEQGISVLAKHGLLVIRKVLFTSCPKPASKEASCLQTGLLTWLLSLPSVNTLSLLSLCSLPRDRIQTLAARLIALSKETRPWICINLFLFSKTDFYVETSKRKNARSTNAIQLHPQIYCALLCSVGSA